MHLDDDVYIAYGHAMEAAQRLEHALVALAQTREALPPDSTLEDNRREVERLFGMTAGQLARRLEISGDVGSHVASVIPPRNFLAHTYFLVLPRLEEINRAPFSKADLLGSLDGLRQSFDGVADDVEELAEAAARERGWPAEPLPSINPDALRRLLGGEVI